MSKPKVTPAPSAPQEAHAPRTIPLSDITITWPPLRDFAGEPEKPITVSGKRLGAIVAWMARTNHGTLSADDAWATTDVWLDLRGLAEILRGLGNADLEMIPSNTPAIALASHAEALSPTCLSLPLPTAPLSPNFSLQLITSSTERAAATLWRQPCQDASGEVAVLIRLTITTGSPFGLRRRPGKPRQEPWHGGARGRDRARGADGAPGPAREGGRRGL